jgi:DNA repair protein RecO (recombination protein O)
MARFEGEAILLRSVDFGESDRIVHLLTEQGARLTAIAKSARRSHRRFPGTLDVFNRLQVEGRTRPRSEMAFLERARLVEAHLGLRASVGRYALASFIVEMLDRLAPEGGTSVDSRRLFTFTRESLALLASIEPRPALRLLLELRALDALGLRPEFTRCVRCARVAGAEIAPDHRVHFHVADGGLVCTACSLRLDGLVPVDLGTLRALADGLAAETADLGALDFEPHTLAQAARLLFRFQRFHVGVELRSERFLDEVLPLSSRSLRHDRAAESSGGE